ncbi:hypothetical protein OK074_4684 [Actinobacteria bacterium OK074]|nr:hypothetical protein OK074_4684 [Actinobacteria bacterium OK074]
MTRMTFRYVPYVIVQDPAVRAEYSARCVDDGCGADSGVRRHPLDVEVWQRGHTETTRHTRYRRTAANYAVMQPREGSGGSGRVRGALVSALLTALSVGCLLGTIIATAVTGHSP